MNDFIFTTEFLTEFSIPDIKNSSISAIILYEDNLRDIYKEDLMGKSSPELVKNSLKGLKIREINVQKNDALIDIVKKNVENEDYVIVLYANTPLIREETISDALSYATTKSLDYCKLYHGAIFKVEAVKINRIEYISEANFLNKEDFFAIFDNKSCDKVREILKNRILDYWVTNGVKFRDKNSCYIEFNVEILDNVEIFSNNVIKGHTLIGKNVKLLENNIITDCEIGENSSVLSSYLQNAKIKKNSRIGPFEKISKEKK